MRSVCRGLGTFILQKPVECYLVATYNSFQLSRGWRKAPSTKSEQVSQRMRMCKKFVPTVQSCQKLFLCFNFFKNCFDQTFSNLPTTYPENFSLNGQVCWEELLNEERDLPTLCNPIPKASLFLPAAERAGQGVMYFFFSFHQVPKYFNKFLIWANNNQLSLPPSPSSLPPSLSVHLSSLSMALPSCYIRPASPTNYKQVAHIVLHTDW